MRHCVPSITAAVAVMLVAAYTGSGAGVAPPARDQHVPAVTGHWTGTWSIWRPGAATPAEAAAEDATRLMECRVTRRDDGRWEATFEGDCGRPYKYTVTMLGRRAGDAVLFTGSADLGEKDGGVYDWIGRAGKSEFVGFYTSRKYTGVFHLTRAAAE